MTSSRYTLIFILLLAFALRFTGSWFGYPWLEQYDESPELVKPALKILDFGNTHGVAPITHNGPLPKYLLAIVFGIWGLGAKLVGSTDALIQLLRDTTAANIAARMVIGVLAGVAGVWVVFLAGRRLAGITAGLAAAFFLAVAFKPVEFAHYATSDTMASLAVSLILLFTLRYYDTGHFRDLSLAAIFWAAGVAIKLSLGPSAILLLVGILARPNEIRSVRVTTALKVAGIGLAAVLLLHLPYLTNPHPYIVTVTDLMLTAVAFYNKAFFWYFYSGVYPSVEIPTAGVGWTWLSLALAGLILSLTLPGRKKWILIAFAVFFYLFLGLSRIKLTRYFIPMLPFLAIWAGVAAAKLENFLTLGISPAVRRAVVAVVVLLFALPNLYHSTLFALQAAGPNTVMDLNRYLEDDLTDADRAVGMVGIPLPSRRMYRSQRGFINKGHYQDGLRRELVQKSPLLKWFVGSGPPVETDPERSLFDTPPDSLHGMRGINTIILDEYKVWDTFNISERYMYRPEDLHSARRFIESVQHDWELVKTFTPKFNQPWGESCAGRQPLIWVYRWKDSAKTQVKP